MGLHAAFDPMSIDVMACFAFVVFDQNSCTVNRKNSLKLNDPLNKIFGSNLLPLLEMERFL
jgi:hypothetical protein